MGKGSPQAGKEGRVRRKHKASQRQIVDKTDAQILESPEPHLRAAMVKIVNDPSATQPCTLLSLPTEIRNRIFTYAVVVDHEIVISLSIYSHPPPSLLIVSKQVREETVYIYYTMNNFTFAPYHYNMVALFPAYSLWKKQFRPLKTGHGIFKYGDRAIACLGSPNWKNLVEWCKLVHSKKMEHFVVEPLSTDATKVAISTIHAVVIKLQESPLEVVEGVVEDLRTFAVQADVGWAN